jgi:hypothetical protein
MFTDWSLIVLKKSSKHDFKKKHIRFFGEFFHVEPALSQGSGSPSPKLDLARARTAPAGYPRCSQCLPQWGVAGVVNRTTGK